MRQPGKIVHVDVSMPYEDRQKISVSQKLNINLLVETRFKLSVSTRDI